MLANAALLEISPAGTTDDYGDVATAAEPTWEGRVRCYLTRRQKVADTLRTRRAGGGEMTLEEEDVLLVPRAGGAPVSEIPGDQARGSTILVEDRRQPRSPVTKRFRVVDVANQAAGIPTDHVRLTLADERAS